jgi:hypothetical protein
MAIQQNIFEGGVDGTLITPANSGGASGDAFFQVTGSVRYSVARANTGTVSAYCSAVTGSTRYARYNTAADTILARSYHYFTSAPDNVVPLRVNGDSGGPVYLLISPTSNQLVVTHGTGIANSTVAVPQNQWVRFELYCKAGTGTGEIRGAFYLGDSTTAQWASTLLTGRTFAGNLYSNCGSSDSTLIESWVDNFGVKSPPDAAWGAWPYTVANVPPVVLPIPNQDVVAAAAVTVTASATDDGSIASYAWTVVTGSSSATPTLTGASTATVTFTAPAAGNLVTLQCVVTDNLAATTTVTTEVRVMNSSTFTVLSLTGTGAAWTNTGGAANDGAALADGSDTTYSESPDYTAVESERRWRLQPLAARSALTLTVRGLVTAAGGVRKIRLYEGTTMRQEWTVTPGTTVGDIPLTVTTPAAISDWGNLYIAAAVTT